ncbi:MAG: hypothetical protein HQL82_01465 [Magnetococcales bacterium]|nr:hypothetical protein [Magnetococcales bacterium]
MNRDSSFPSAAGVTGAGQRLFPLLALLSGLCGIAYEVLLGRFLHNLLGDQFAVSAAILMAFVLGMGLGALIAHWLWRWLWLIEGLIGLFAVVLVALAAPLEDALRVLYQYLGPGRGVDLLFSVVLLALPTLLIGCGIPLFAGYYQRLRGGRFATTYALYHLGAALTVLAVEYLLVRTWGLTAAIHGVAAVNGLVAVTLLLFYRPVGRAGPPVMERLVLPRRLLLALFCGSLASALFQLLMVQMAGFLFGPFRETFALVLALVFFGLAIGPLLTLGGNLGLGRALLLAVLGLLALLGGLEPVAQLYAGLYPLAEDWLIGIAGLKLLMLILLMGVPAVAFGALIPALLNSMDGGSLPPLFPSADRDATCTVARQGHVARDSGRLLFLSSLANGLGFLLLSLFLYQRLAHGEILLLAGALLVAGWLLVQRVTPIRGMMALGLLVLLWLHWARAWPESMLYLGHTVFRSTERLQEARDEFRHFLPFKGRRDVVSITRFKDQSYFFFNGYRSIPLSDATEVMVGALAGLLAPRTNQAVVLGLGTGKTASAVARLFDHTDVVEINPVMLGMQEFLQGHNLNLARQTRVAYHMTDGMLFLKGCRQPRDLILNTVTTPLYFSAAKLYTVDFLRDVQRCLAPDGVYMTWVDFRVGEAGLAIILKSLAQVFPHQWLAVLNTHYYLLFGSMGPLGMPDPQRVVRNADLAGFFQNRIGILPEWLPYALANLEPQAYVAQRVDVPVNTLDHPVLEFAITREEAGQFHRYRDWLGERLELPALARALGGPFAWNSHEMHLFMTEQLGRNNPFTKRVRAVMMADGESAAAFLEARLQATAALARRIDTPASHQDWGRTLMHEERWAQAIEVFQEIHRRWPARRGVHYQWGRCLAELGYQEGAMAEYRRELALNTRHRNALYRLGMAELSRGLVAEGTAHVERAWRLDD